MSTRTTDLQLWGENPATDCPTCGYPFPAMQGSITDPIDHECQPPRHALRMWPDGTVTDPVKDGRAVARSTDPGTSWEAARSITPEKLRESQRQVLDALIRFGPQNDEDIAVSLRAMGVPMSLSGSRTRRSELVALGRVRDSGRKDVLRSGRRAIVWEAV